ncbi:MAG: YdcF family protein [Anaerolineaceae bacterium]|nr:YdcF family protein [Anaerolineaceae bacterium]
MRKSDVVIAMGSHDLRVATYAAQLVLEGWAPLLICSGGSGRLTGGIWQESEAAHFAAAAVKKGLPLKKILQEDRSTNTGENLLFTKALCKKHGIPTKTVLLVHKPYMERRVWAAVQKVWPEPQASITSPPILFEAYPTKEIPIGQVIQIMVGDFQRILLYPEKGFAVPQPVPDEVMDAFNLLVFNGFTQHLI